MTALQTPICNFGASPPTFSLQNTGRETCTLQDSTGPNGLLVMFICNHCPFVLSIIDNLVSDCRQLIDAGIGVVAICSNDAATYPDDSFPNMQRFAKVHNFPFAYLHDPTQQTASDYGAVCTPDFFGYNGQLQLQYRGRFDDSKRNQGGSGRRELRDAMLHIASQGPQGKGPTHQLPSIGCSIKWKAA